MLKVRVVKVHPINWMVFAARLTDPAGCTGSMVVVWRADYGAWPSE